MGVSGARSSGSRHLSLRRRYWAGKSLVRRVELDYALQPRESGYAAVRMGLEAQQMVRKRAKRQRRGLAEKGESYSPNWPSTPEAWRREVQKGIDDVRAGRVVPFEEVQAWIESWDTPHELPMPKPRKR